MLNLDNITNENNEENNLKWPCISDHPYRMLIIVGSESGKSNALLKLISNKIVAILSTRVISTLKT